MLKKCSLTVWQGIAEILSAAAVLATSVTLSLRWKHLAEKIPSHYDKFGQPDAWCNKGMLLALVIVQLVLFVGITVLLLFPKVWNIPIAVSEAGKVQLLRKTRTLICTMKLLLSVGIGIIIFFTAIGKQLSGWLSLLMIIAVIGNMICYFVGTAQISLQEARRAINRDLEQ